MAKKMLVPVLVTAVVTAGAMSMERESDGSFARNTDEVRSDLVIPALGALAGSAGDALLVVREEFKRQGVNPGAVLSGSTATIQTNPRDVSELPPLEGDELP